MPSLKSHLVSIVLRLTRKKAFRSPEGLHAWIARARKVQDHRPPAEVAGRLDVAERSVGGHPVYEARPRGMKAGRRVLYLHGGAYCFELTRFHWLLIAEMAERLDAHLTIPVYPLAPEHDFHAIYKMATQVYREVLGESDGVVVMGDSAGGNMALVLAMMAAREGWPAPSRLVLISPAVDLTLANPRTEHVARIDPWLDIPGGREAFRLFAADLPFGDWRISPLYGDLSVLPPALIFTGTRDLLQPDTVIFAERARAAGAEVELVVGDGMIHVWPLIDMPEARIARTRIVDWLSAQPPATATPRDARART